MLMPKTTACRDNLSDVSLYAYNLITAQDKEIEKLVLHPCFIHPSINGTSKKTVTNEKKKCSEIKLPHRRKLQCTPKKQQRRLHVGTRILTAVLHHPTSLVESLPTHGA